MGNAKPAPRLDVAWSCALLTDIRDLLCSDTLADFLPGHRWGCRAQRYPVPWMESLQLSGQVWITLGLRLFLPAAFLCGLYFFFVLKYPLGWISLYCLVFSGYCLHFFTYWFLQSSPLLRKLTCLRNQEINKLLARPYGRAKEMWWVRDHMACLLLRQLKPAAGSSGTTALLTFRAHQKCGCLPGILRY